MRLDELGQDFDLELAHEDVDSVSGLILTLLGRPPRVGDSVRYDRLRSRRHRGEGHGVDESRGVARRLNGVTRRESGAGGADWAPPGAAPRG